MNHDNTGTRNIRGSRRLFVQTMIGTAAGLALAACGPAPASPTAAPPAPKPTTAPAAEKPAPAPAATKPAAAPTAAPKTAAPAAKAPRAVWKQAHVPLTIDTTFYELGKEKGFFDEMGIDAQYSTITDGNTATKAIIAGEIDSGNPGATAVFLAIEQGAPVKIMGTALNKVTQYLFAKTDIKSLEDLYGRNVGVATFGAYLHQLATAAMKLKGLDPDKVNWVNVGASPDVWAALVAGKIDAGVSSLDFVPDLPKNPHLHTVVSFAEALPNYLRDGIPISEKNLAERKDVAIRAMTAMVKGIRHGLENKNDFIALAKKLTGRDEEKIGFVYDHFVKNRIVEPNFRLSPDAIAYTQQVTIDAGQMKAVLPFSKVATDEITKAVIANLGEYQYKQ